MTPYEIARRLKGHRATHPMASMSQLEHLVTYIWNTKPEAKHAWAMIASVWAFLWVERAQMDKHSITPSATALAYVTKAETFIAKAETDAPGAYAASNAPKIVAWCSIAQNYAYAWLELTRAEQPLPE